MVHLLQAMFPQPLDLQVQQPIHSAGGHNHDKSANTVADQPRCNDSDSKDSQPVKPITGNSFKSRILVRFRKPGK